MISVRDGAADDVVTGFEGQQRHLKNQRDFTCFRPLQRPLLSKQNKSLGISDLNGNLAIGYGRCELNFKVEGYFFLTGKNRVQIC
jgi:hypothetical protein